MQLNRSGFTLAELVVATTLSGILAMLVGRVLSRAASQLEARKERSAAEQVLRSGESVIRGLLQAGEESGSDLAGIAPGTIAVRAFRGDGVLCDVQPSAVVARKSPPWWRGVRQPVGGRDSLAIARLTQPGWVFLALRADPGPLPCPDGTPGMILPVSGDPSILPDLGAGSPVRFFEPVELRSYSSSGSEWLGLRSIPTGESIQPLAGPLARSGLRLDFRAADGAAALDPSRVAFVVLRVTAPAGREWVDSLAGWVALKGSWQ